METHKTLNFNVHVQLMKDVSTMVSGDSFGELSILTGEPRAATVYARGSNVSLCSLSKLEYLTLIGESFKLKMEKTISVIKMF